MTLEDFCFDVLGDFVNPNSIEIMGDKVIVLRHGDVPAEIIRDEWNRRVQGTEFENIWLFI